MQASVLVAGAYGRCRAHKGKAPRETHRGKLVGSTQLASGRFAMIDDGLGFQLVPWQPVLDQRIGQHITGTMRGGGIEWSFGRKRGLGLCEPRS